MSRDQDADTTPDLRAKYAELTEGLHALNAKTDEKLKLIEEKEEKWNRICAEVERQASLGKERVKLNIGGRMFMASRETLLRWEGTYFHALLASPERWQRPSEEDGAYFIDRDPEPFERIMTSLRSGSPVEYEGLDARARKRLKVEVDYYQVPSASGLAWSPDHCSSNLRLSESNTLVTKTGRSGWNASVLGGVEVSRVKIRMLTGGSFCFGFAKLSSYDSNVERAFERSNAWVFSTGGGLWVGKQRVGQVVPGEVGEDSMVGLWEASLDKASSRIEFKIDGSLAGTISTGCLQEHTVLPFLELYGAGASVRLEV